MTRNHNLKKMSISLSAAMLSAAILALNNSKPVKADAADNDHLETDSNGQNDPVVQAKKQEFNRDETKNESIVGELKKVMSDDKSSTDNSDDSKNGNNYEENNNSARKQEFNYDHVKYKALAKKNDTLSLKNGINDNTVNPQNSLQKFNDLTANVNLDDKSALNSNFVSLPVNKAVANNLQLFNRNTLLDSKLLADDYNGKKPDLHKRTNWEDPAVQGFTKTAVGYSKYYQNYNRIAKKGSVIIDNNYSNTPLQNINCNISDGFAFGVNLSATIDKHMFNDAAPVLVGTIAQLNQDDRTLRWSGDENTKNNNVYDDNGQRLGYIYSERHDSSSGFGYAKGEEVDYFFVPNNDIKPAKDVSFDFHIDHSYAINCWQNHYKNLRYTSQNNPAKFQWVTLDKNSADKSVPVQVNLWQFNDHLRNGYNHVDPWVWNPSLYWQSITSNAQYTPEGDPINLPQVNQVLEVKRLPDNTGYVNLFNSNINLWNNVHYDYRLINEDGTGFYETIWRPYETYYHPKRLPDGLTNVEVQKAAEQDWRAGGYGAVYSLSSDRKSLLIGLNYDATTDRYQQLHNFNEAAFRTAIRDYAETSYTNNISHPGHLDQLVKQTVDFYKKQNYNSNNLWYEISALNYENHDKNVIEQVNDVTPGKTAVIGQINSQSPNGSSADVSLYRNIPVRYVDDDENGKEIGTDSIIGITKQDLTVDPSMDITVPKKYVLASYDKLDYGIVSDKDNPVITIHLKHKIIGSVGDLKENAKNTRNHLLDSVKNNSNIEIVHDQDVSLTADIKNQQAVNNRLDQISSDYINQEIDLKNKIKDWQADGSKNKLILHYHNDNLMLSKTSVFQVIQKMPNGKYGQDPVVFKTTITANKDIAQDIVTGRENESDWTGKNTNGTVQVGSYDPDDPTVIEADGIKIAGYHFNPFNYDSKEMYYGPNYTAPNRNDGNFYLVSSSNGHVYFDYLWGRNYHDDNSNITFNDFPDDQTWYLTLSPDDQTADIQFVDEDDSNKQVATSTIKGLTDQLTKLDWSNRNNNYAKTLANLYNQGYYIDLPELNNTTNPSLEDVINALNTEDGQYDFSSMKDTNGNWVCQYSPMVVKLKHRIANVDIAASHLTQTYEVDYYIPQTGNEIDHSTKLTAKYKRDTKEDLVTKKYTYGKWQLDPTSLNDLTQLSRGYVPINVSNRAGYAIEIETAKSNSTYHETTNENDHTLLPIALGNFNNSYHELVRKGTTAIGVNVVPSFDVNNFNLDPSNWATNTVIHVKYIPWIRQLKGHIYVGGNSTALKDEPILSDQYHTGDTIQIDYSKLPQKVYDNLDDKQTDYEFDIPEGQMSTRYLTNLVPGENYDPYYNPDNPNASLWHGWDVIDLNTEAIYDKLPNEVKSVTRIIKINGKTVKEEVKSVRRSRLRNEATGEIVYGYYSNASFDEYKISKMANSNSYVSLNGEPAYEADQIDSLDIDEDTPDKLVYNITFDQDEAQQLVNFVTKKGVVIDSTMLTGKYGSTKKADTSNLPDGWSLANEQDAYVKVLNGTSNILVVHPIIEVTPDNSVTSNTPICGELVYPSGLTSNDLTANTSRTIVLHYPNSDPESIVQNVKFTRIGYFDPNEYDPNVADNSDCVTYSNWTTDNGTLSEYKPENYHGLTPTKDKIAEITLTKPEKNMTDDVYYNEGSKSIEVAIRDNSESSNDVKTSSRQIVSGNIGEEKDIALDIAPGQYLTGISHGFSLLYDNGQYIIKANKDLTDSDHPYNANSRALRSIRHLTLKYTFGETNLPFQVFTSHELKNVNNVANTNDQNSETNVPEASLKKTVSRKIIVNLPDGNVNVINEEVKFERTAKKDMSTGKIIYTPWELAPESRNEEHYVYTEAGDKSSIDYKKGKLLGFKVDSISGYDVLNPNDGQNIIIDPNSDVNTELKDVVISYAPKMQKSAIIFVQKGSNKYDSSRNVSINSQTYEIIGGRSFTGRTNEAVSLKEYQHDYTIPAGYQVVKNGHPGLYDKIPDSYLFKAVNNEPIYIEVNQSPL